MRLRKRHDFSGQVLHRGEIFFSEPGHVIRRILCRFQKHKLTIVTKCTDKKLLAKKETSKSALWGSFWRKHLKENKKTQLNHHKVL
jgi:hypothetical protein